MAELNKAFIMRGIPGSGKSTVAESLALSAGPGEFILIDGIKYLISGEDKIAAIHSTDAFFLNEKGEYVYDRRMIGANHGKNFKAFSDSIDVGLAVVICDNTNTALREYRRYMRKAKRAGYIVSVVTLEHPSVQVAVDRNTHSVPEDVIKRMINRWEPWNGKV